MDEIHPQIFDFNGLYFNGDQSLIAGRRIYSVNNNIVFRLNNGSIVDIYTIRM